MPASEALKALVARMPDPCPNATYVNLDDAKIAAIRQVVGELHQGGAEAARGLIDMLVEPGQGDDLKAHFALHLLAVHVTGLGDDKARADFAQVLAAEVGRDRPRGVRRYLIQELQVAGGREAIDALGRLLPDPDLCDEAARALAAIGDGAAETLLGALAKVEGRGRLSILKKLGVLRCGKAAEAFRAALEDADADIRIAGAWGIARIADASAAAALLKAADAHEGWERFNETDACLALAEALVAAGRKAEAAAIYTHLRDTRTGAPERHVRDAAERGLAAAR